jgi:prevent-host-death family protein
MKSVSLAEAQANLPELLRVVESGEEVHLTRRKRAVAKIVSLTTRKLKGWPQHFAKLDKISNGKRNGKPGSRIIIEGRR